MTTWLDAAADELDRTAATIRAQLRAAHVAGAGRWSTITLTHRQATAILRGVVPSSVAVTPRRAQHARLAAALGMASAQLLRLNADPASAPNEAAIAAALDLAAEAREWARQAQWSAATKTAKVKGWACPPLAISRITQLLTAEQTEAAPSASDGRRARLATGWGFFESIRPALQLDLPLPSAAVVDLRQHSLQLDVAA